MSHMKWIPYRLEDTRHILECMELASLQATKANGTLHSKQAEAQYCRWCQVQATSKQLDWQEQSAIHQLLLCCL